MNIQTSALRRSIRQSTPSWRRTIAQAAAAATTPEQAPQRRARLAIDLPRLWNEDDLQYAMQGGVHERSDPQDKSKRLYSHVGFANAYMKYQLRILRELNERLAGRGFQGTPRDLIVQTARDPTQAALFNYASMAYNNHFFFEGITFSMDMQMPEKLHNAIIKDFGSVEILREEMLTMADAMFGPGFIWLVRTKKTKMMDQDPTFKLLATYGAGSPLSGAHNRRQPVDMNTQNVADALKFGGAEGLSKAHAMLPQHMTPQNNVGAIGTYARPDPNQKAFGGVDVTPCLCLSTWEHSYVWDWVYNKKAFSERWWKFINWNRVSANSGVESEVEQRAGFQYTNHNPYMFGR